MDGDAWWYGGAGGGGVGGGNNWDLDAIVRFGCGGGHVTVPPPECEYDDPFSSLLVPPMTHQVMPVWGDDDDVAAWMAPLPGLQTGGWDGADHVVVDDLSGALFGVSVQAPKLPAPPQVAAAEVTPPNLVPAAADAAPVEKITRPAIKQQASGDGAGAGGSRSARRKKKQQAKEVVRVPANGPPPDSWAWRKYGQKPIKGSPYPRGYYRCSSNKNCGARKQVERCRVDPSFLVLTYTGAHSGHDVPLHRNSLAGTTRHKLVLPSNSCKPEQGAGAGAAEAGTTDKNALATSSEAASSSHSHSPAQSTSPGLSPTTPLLTSSMEMHGEEEDCDDVDGAAGLQAEDVDMTIVDDDDAADDTIHHVPWGTPISDAIIAASYEWR
ncbi:WRKY transcription factor SUSIBA2-like [Oryza brachyantha]|uniref:WRKY transcription factor SUSIBA2-like n=1 Tax=Oryza brachyantha TaxID=4533 RepID=UPI001AD9CE9F|nr:WRKY transcription factor SUSIBA2-like [Oryza brachyantha]